ncbi:MAG: hypothetical protein V3U30_00125 [Thermoplasmata archaeon]
MFRAARSLVTLILNDLRGVVIRPKTVASLVLVGLTFLLLAWAISQAALIPVDPESVNPSGLWQRGVNGAFTTLFFGIAPILLPILPLVIAYDTREWESSTGFLEMSASRPVPRSILAMGKVISLYVITALPILALWFVGAILIQLPFGPAVDRGLLLGSLVSSLLGTALYLVLVLVFMVLWTPSTALALSLLLWALCHVLSPTALLLTAQLLLIVPSSVVISFQASFVDVGSFAGLHQGLLAVFVPAELGFVVLPSLAMWPALIAAWAAAIGGIPWLIGLVVLFVILFNRLQVS